MAAAVNFQSELESQAKPLKVAGREAYVYPRYQARAHEHADVEAVVTKNGTPIVSGGETLTLGKVPIERRFAIGPVQSGRAEVMQQHLFEEELLKNYIEEYQMKGQAPSNPNLMYRPSVLSYVAVKVDPTDARKVVHLGFLPGRVETPSTPEEKMQEIEVLRADRDKQAMEMDELKRKLDALLLMNADKKAEKIAAKAASEVQVEAPCGKLLPEGKLKQHQNFCKHQSCQDDRNARRAAEAQGVSA